MLTRGKAVEVLAYTAGLIDGEGYVGINYVKAKLPHLKRKYIGAVAMGSTDKELIYWMQEEWGGYVFPKTKTRPEYRPVWGWQANNKIAYALLVAILPYLRTKKKQAELWIEYWEKKKRYNRTIVQDPVNGRIVAHPDAPDEETAWRDSIVQQIRALNSQPQRLSETAPGTGEAIV
jgi:hypothetical protein